MSETTSLDLRGGPSNPPIPDRRPPIEAWLESLNSGMQIRNAEHTVRWLIAHIQKLERIHDPQGHEQRADLRYTGLEPPFCCDEHKASIHSAIGRLCAGRGEA